MKKTPPVPDLTNEAPLAWRMRPRNLDEYVGQQAVIGPGAQLRRAIEGDEPHSFILYGPAGSGKTSLAAVVAAATKASFERLSAVSAGVRDVREIIDRAKVRQAQGERTILFLDEIHRFNKGQQDALLPAVEGGVISMIGATTENPFFEVNSPLISRARIYVLEPLVVDDIKTILKAALADKDRGLGGLGLKYDEAAVDLIAEIAGGDARRALNTLEAAARLAAADKKGITLDLAKEVAGERTLGYDKSGDVHYDVASAFI